MGQSAIDYIGVKGGLDINGVIESYYVYAGENVNAGDFVEFIEGIADKTSTTYETQVRKAITAQCDGVAKTSGIGGDETSHNQQVQIYIPDI